MQFKRIQKAPAYLLCLLIAACNNSITPVTADKITDSIPKTKITTPASDTIYTGDTSATILIIKEDTFIKGHITANGPQPAYTLSGLKGQTITATIKPLAKGSNLRINQVQKPDGSFDGPFGDSLSYTMMATGNISFIIKENMMAGDPWSGYFILHLKVK